MCVAVVEGIVFAARFLVLILLLACLACSDKKQEELDATAPETKQDITFDASKWKIKEDRDYPYRDSMLKDLMSNDTIRQFKKADILDLLGEPTRIDNNYLFYMVAQNRFGFWPLHTKTLVIKLYADSTINWMKIHE